MKRLPFQSRVAGCLAAGVVMCSNLSGLAQTGPVLPIAIRPEIRILSPADHAVFYAPVDIPIFAYVDTEFYGVTTNVEFYANGTNIGSGIDLGAAMPPTAWSVFPLVRTITPALKATYCLVWTNVPPGTYTLTAVAKGLSNAVTPVALGLNRTSAPVYITNLVSSVVPPTNAPDVVSIVATDPIAIAGTNIWFWPGSTNPLPSWTNWPPPVPVRFTNWGPKSALFTVRRFGDATDAITVTYSIGGTASNGVDYAKLPGSVMIPAGGAYALIPVVPIGGITLSNGLGPITSNTWPKTVVISLTADTNTPPDYTVGIPPKASALILNDWPRPLPLLLADGSFHLNAAGPDGAWFVVESSPDLINWTPICTNQTFQGSIDYLDADAAANPNGYYRAVPLNTTPMQ